jgi:hypothetical protein
VSFFETPKFSPLRVDGVLKGDKLILSTEQLLKAYEIIKADKTNLFAGTVKAGNRAYGLTLESVAFEVNQLAKQLEIVKGDQFKFRVDQFDKIRVKDVTLFNTPKSSTFKISGVVTGDRIRLRTENLPLQVEKVKDGYAKLSTDSLTKAYEIIRSDKVPYAPPAQVKSVKVPTNATEVFYTPKVDKLNSTDVLRDSKARLTTDKLNSTDVLKDLQYNIGVSALQKAYETLREELAGRRIKAEHMSLIDNQGAFGTDPLPIMQVSNVFYDTSTWYLYDEDQLVPTILYNTLTQTIVFQNTTPWLFLPGSTVVLTDSFTLNQFTATILASTPNSVTIVSIPGFPSTVALGTIRSASVEVFPQSAVFTNTTPKNPRENLYYFNITPAFRADRWQQIGSYSTTYTSNRIVNDNRQTGRLAASEKVKSPGKQLVNSLAFGKSSGIRIKQSVDSALLNVASLEKYKEPARNNFTFSLDTIGLVDLRDFVREATNPRTLDVGVLAQVPRPPNAELAYQVFYLPLSGNLAKFKTGDFKLGSVGVQDLNYTKQQPIQFWS